MLYNGNGIVMNDTKPFEECVTMRQPFRLNFSTSKVVILVTICRVDKTDASTKDSIVLETYETSSVYNLSKLVEAQSAVKSTNMVIYYSRKIMKVDRSLSHYGI